MSHDPLDESAPWGTRVEQERRRRIRLCVWAYAYEIKDQPLVPDSRFDAEAYLVDLEVDTANPQMDAWFRASFKPFTGSWIHTHPNKKGLEYAFQVSLDHKIRAAAPTIKQILAARRAADT